MWKNKKWFLISGVLAGMIGIIGGYQYISRYYDQEKTPIDPIEQVEQSNPNTLSHPYKEKEFLEDEIEQEESQEVVTRDVEKILPSTKFIYQYYYALDQTLEEEEMDPPYYLLDITREELQEKLSDWELQSFSDKKVILRKVIQEKSPHHYYLVGVYDGYLAVFYDIDGEWVLREITSTPLSALSFQEQKKLQEGIGVHGEEELIRILEDYTS
ncbi:MAG: hypothetical protein GX347_04155 [Epulopiscium sp.]|nr:hypothetical protein [Candidatus Epulonipiscium sp.]